MFSKTWADRAITCHGKLRSRLPGTFTRPLGVFLYITSQCNLNCPYCRLEKKQFSTTAWQDSGINPMPPNDWERLVTRLPRWMYIGISGGEPTLSPALPPIIRSAGPTRPVTVNTNAANWTDEHLDLFTRAGVKNISVSLDGFAQVHDTVRNMPGLFDKVVENIARLNRKKQALGKKSPSLTIKTVLQDQNLYDLERFFDFCAHTLCADAWNLSFMISGNHAQFSILRTLEKETLFRKTEARLHEYGNPRILEDAVDRILKKSVKSRIKVQLSPAMASGKQVSKYLTGKGRSGYKPCFLPWSQVVVLPDGHVIPCLSLSLGNVRDRGYRLTEVLKDPGYEDFLTFIRTKGGNLPGACLNCCYARFGR